MSIAIFLRPQWWAIEFTRFSHKDREWKWRTQIGPLWIARPVDGHWDFTIISK